MKRFLLTVLLFLSVLLSVSAVSFEAHGSGKTLDEAKEDARRNLAETVFSGLYVGRTETRTEDGTDGYSASFSESSSYSVVGEFPGLEYTVLSSEKKKYTVSVSLTGDEQTLAFYSNRVNEQKKTVEILYSRYSSLPSSETVTEKRETLETVIEAYNYYNIYSNVLLRLGTKADSLDIPTTLEVLLVDYQSLLCEEQNELEKKSSIESISSEIKAELQKNREKQKEYAEEQKESQAQAELKRRLVLEQEISDIIRSGNTSGEEIRTDGRPGKEAFENYVAVIKEALSSYVEASDRYDELVREESSSIEESFEEEAAAIRKRAYPNAYLDSAGLPSDDAVRMREEEVSALRKEKDKEKKEALESIESAIVPEIKKRLEYLNKTVDAFRKKEFTFHSSGDELSLTSRYDAASYSWLLSVSAEGNYPVELSTSFSYKDLTGKEIPSDDKARLKFIKGDDYIENVDLYTELLNTGEYDAALTLTADVEASGVLMIYPGTLQISFTGGKKISISLEEEDAEKISLGVVMSSGNWVGNKKTAGKDVWNGEEEDKSKPVCPVLSLQLGMTAGEITAPQRKWAIDFMGEGRLVFAGVVYISATASFALQAGENLETDVPTKQYALWAGVGLTLFRRLTVAVRYTRNSEIGDLINPYVSLKTFTSDISDWDSHMDIYAGCIYNLKTGKYGITVGLAGVGGTNE